MTMISTRSPAYGTDTQTPAGSPPTADQPAHSAPPESPSPAREQGVMSASVTSPDSASSDLASPDLASSDLTSPDLTKPDVTNPDLANPSLANPSLGTRELTAPDTIALEPSSLIEITSPAGAEVIDLDVVPGPLAPSDSASSESEPGPPAPSAEPGVRLPWVVAVSPCFNRRRDIELLLGDLARLDVCDPSKTGSRRPVVELTTIIVDNASTVPLNTIPTPPGLDVVHFRSPVNGGGAGGFNAGMRHALGELARERGRSPDYIWLLDSDVRTTPRALVYLLDAMERLPRVCAVGSALRDPVTGFTYEVGGLVDRRTGFYRPAASGPRVDPDVIVYCDYLAACSALIRREALEASGLMPEVFLNGDDVELFLHMSRRTGLQVCADPRSAVYHPWRKFQVLARYFIARNSFAPLATLGLGPRARFRRGVLETYRAVAQTLMSASDLARLHVAGLSDAAGGRISGPAPKEVMPRTKLRPFAELEQAIRELRAEAKGAAVVHQGEPIGASVGTDAPEPAVFVHPYLCAPHSGLNEFRREIARLGLSVNPGPWRHRRLGEKLNREVAGAMARLVRAGLRGASHDIAIVPTGWPTSWFRGRWMIEIATDGFLVERVQPWRNVLQAAQVAVRGFGLCARLAFSPPRGNPLPPAPIGAAIALRESRPTEHASVVEAKPNA
ncbi:MAG: glycosyltransferase [Planctomycetota bacterium]|nr:glycosyltransferase [Planctomycetota bacterium]